MPPNRVRVWSRCALGSTLGTTAGPEGPAAMVSLLVVAAVAAFGCAAQAYGPLRLPHGVAAAIVTEKVLLRVYALGGPTYCSVTFELPAFRTRSVSV